jgi:ABC-2 type transport system permease protein
MRGFQAILKRELAALFKTPVAYVFLTIFLIFSSLLTFFVGQWYESGQADLSRFFNFHPWLYLLLIPAISMRLWAEENKMGTLELLLTLPVSLSALVLGKFVAAWLFIGFSLLLTFPMWLTVSYLGDPDHGVILLSYLGSWFMSGGFLAIGICLSAMTNNQVIAFVLTASICFLGVVMGFSVVLDWFSAWVPTYLLDALASLSLLHHFEALMRGEVQLRSLVYYLLLITWGLVLCAWLVRHRQFRG